MKLLTVLVARIRGWWRRDVISEEIRDEMETHVQMRTEEFVRRGLTAEEGRRKALQQFGNLAVLHDRGYDVRGGGLVENLIQDLQYAFRMVRRRPGFSVVAILMLMLGIGGNTAVFSILDALLMRSLPVERPNDLVRLVEGGLDLGSSREAFVLTNQERLQRASHTLEGVSASEVSRAKRNPRRRREATRLSPTRLGQLFRRAWCARLQGTTVPSACARDLRGTDRGDQRGLLAAALRREAVGAGRALHVG